MDCLDAFSSLSGLLDLVLELEIESCKLLKLQMESLTIPLLRSHMLSCPSSWMSSFQQNPRFIDADSDFFLLFAIKEVLIEKLRS